MSVSAQHQKNTSILVVDDEIDIREIIQFNLEYEGFHIDPASSAEEALKILSPAHKLIILDVMMGGMSGFKMAEQLRKSGNNIPIIFLTAKSTENDMLTGFSIGADDYITKPFSIKELVARVRSILKRTMLSTAVQADDMVYEAEGMLVNFEMKTLIINSETIELTKTEFDILALFVQNEGKIFSREDILNRVWKEQGVMVADRTVDVHIARLRKKLLSYGSWITNRSGYGYTFKSQCSKNHL